MGNLVNTGSSNQRHIVVALPNAETASDGEKPTQAVIIDDAIIYIGRNGFMGIKWHDEPW